MLARAWLLVFVFALLALLVLARLFHLQVISGADYAEAVNESRLSVAYDAPRRGRIIDAQGTVMVDNRAVYDIAVVLARLEHDRHERSAVRFMRFDRPRFDALLADLSAKTLRDPLLLRQLITEEFESFPGVGLRTGRVMEQQSPALLFLPQEHFVDAARILRGEGEAFDEVLIDPQQLGVLAESGLLHDDPRAALERELTLLGNTDPLVLTDDELTAVLHQLGQAFDVPYDLLVSVVAPFAPHVRVDIDDNTSYHWRLLGDERRNQAEDAVARFLGVEFDDVHQEITQATIHVRESTPADPWFYVPAALGGKFADMLPPGLSAGRADLDGAPGRREQIYIVQGADGDDGGMLDILVHRLAASINFDPDEIRLSLGRHGEEVGRITLERSYRVPVVVFDSARLERLTHDLAVQLQLAGVEGYDVLEVERAVTKARRIADRDWRGATRHDPIPIIHDLARQRGISEDPNIGRELAIALTGAGAEIPPELSGEYTATGAELPGLVIHTRLGRKYPYPKIGSHIIGWLGKLSAEIDRREALALGLDPQGWTGRRGLEGHYDELLQGVLGRQVRMRTPTGWKLVQDRAPVAGSDLEVTIDMHMQLECERALERWIELAAGLGLVSTEPGSDVMRALEINKGRAGMVLMDCHTGALLALASTPRFDLNTVRRDYRELIDPEISPGQPLHDHSCQAAQPPGSTIKPLVALVALVEGKVGVHEVISSPGYMQIWQGQQILRDHGGHARDYTLQTAIQKSSNVVFAKLAQRVGPDRLSAWCRKFGLGMANGIDVAWQRPGLLPSPHTIARDRPSDPHWYDSDSWRLGIGQFLSSSPLQMVSIPAAVANGGTILRPYLWRGLAEQAVVEQLDLKPGHIAVVREGMELVTALGGTASKLHLDGAGAGIKVAAKTGTSEWGSRASRARGETPDNAWLVGYAPADDPKVAFAIYVHAAGTSGGRACTGVAKRVLEQYFEHYGAGGHRGSAMFPNR